MVTLLTIGESCAASIVVNNKTEEQLYGILEDAVINNDLKLVRALHTYKGIDLDHKGDDGNVVLFIPVDSDWNIDMTELLLELGTNVNAISNHGWTALQIAAQGGATDTLDCLLGYGADVTTKNKDDNYAGWTALHFAAKWGTTRQVESLLIRGADPNARTKDGKRPIDLARENTGFYNGNIGLILFLEQFENYNG